MAIRAIMADSAEYQPAISCPRTAHKNCGIQSSFCIWLEVLFNLLLLRFVDVIQNVLGGTGTCTALSIVIYGI